MQLNGSRRLQIFLMLFLVTFGAGMVIQRQVLGATSDTSDGSFTLNSTPDVSSVDFVDNAYALTSTLTPDDSTLQGVNFTLAHSATMSDIKNVTIYIYDDSVYGADAADGVVSAATDGNQLVSITWIETSDTYQVSQGSLTQWTVNTGASVDPGAAAGDTTFEFSVQFDISQVAWADTDWNVTVTAYDDDATPESDSDSETGLATMSDFFSVSFSAGTFSWGNDIQPGSTNNTHGPLTITVVANTQWELVISAIDFTPGPIDVEANNILMWDEDGSAGGTSQWVRNTANPAQGTWDNQARHSTEAGANRNVYVFLTDPGGLFSVGQLYTTTLTILIQANT